MRHEGEPVAEHQFEAGRVIAGRAPDNEIYIKSKFVSRHHAQLISDDHGCVVEDLNSTNGVYIGENRVKRYRLKDGDVVSMGMHQLVYTDLRNAEQADDAVPSLEDQVTGRFGGRRLNSLWVTPIKTPGFDPRVDRLHDDRDALTTQPIRRRGSTAPLQNRCWANNRS